MAELAGQEVHSLAGLVQHLDLMEECRVVHFQAVELIVVQAQVLLDHGDWTPPVVFISSSQEFPLSLQLRASNLYSPTS